MRIIHTADWHIGQKLAGYPRDGEHRAALNELAFIVAEQNADALLIAGDVFDHQNPSGESQQLFYSAILALKRARPGLTIVITAGNHDAAGRLEAPYPLLAAMGVHIVGNVARTQGKIQVERHVITLANAEGKPAARVLAVSYPTPACLPIQTRATDASDAVVCSTEALYDELMDAAHPHDVALPLIVMGHLHVAGGLETEGSERRLFVGGQHAVKPDVFPAEAAYVALGHLHKMQWVGRETIRYSGSLIPLSASEIGYEHSVTLLTFAAGDPTPEIKVIPLTRSVPFLRVPRFGTLAIKDLDRNLALLHLDPTRDSALHPFVQVWLTYEDRGSRAGVDAIAAKYPLRLVEPRFVRPELDKPASILAAPYEKLADLKPEDLFEKAFVRKHTKAPDAAHFAAFHIASRAANEV